MVVIGIIIGFSSSYLIKKPEIITKPITTELVRDSLVRDTLYKANDSIVTKIIYLNKEYERKKDSIINNDVSSDLLFFSAYVESYTNRYDSLVDSCKQR